MKKLVLIALCATGCGEGSGSLAVTISGEQAAVSGYPVDTIGFVDGWTLEFDVLVVAVHDFELHATDGDDAGIAVDPVLVDLTSGDAIAWELDVVGARRWDDVRYRIGPAVAGAREIGDIDPALRDRMIDEGISIFVEATAHKDTLTRRISYQFTTNTAQSRCVAGDGTDGLVIANGAQNQAEITTHWDHLFFDSLALDNAQMRFDAIAAVATDDTPITLADLSAQRLADLRGLDGGPLVDEEGQSIVYDPGSTPLPEPTLRAMIEAVATTIGHFQGEGHCLYTAL